MGALEITLFAAFFLFRFLFINTFLIQVTFIYTALLKYRLCQGNFPISK